jgi:hypothetical protein
MMQSGAASVASAIDSVSSQRRILNDFDTTAPQLVCVDPSRVRECWPHVAPFLRAAIERTNLDRFDEIERDVLAGRSLLWLAWSNRVEAAATTVLTETDAGRVCVLTACGGRNMKRWLPLLRTIEAYARAEGCGHLRIFGRKGWQRVLEDYRVTNIILERNL